MLAVATNHTAQWDGYNQSAVLAPLGQSRAAKYVRTRFAVHGSPAAQHAVAGFDRTSYNGHDPASRPGLPVSGVSGVFAGWTAADVVAPAADIARFAYECHQWDSNPHSRWEHSRNWLSTARPADARAGLT
eukprot:7196828-Prymnesium_polylepis.1